VDKTKYRNQARSSDELFEVSDSELESTLESYLEQEEKEVKAPKLLNFISATGLAFLTVGFLSVVQIFLPFSFDFTGLLNALPIFGGIMVALVGLGLFTRTKSKKKKKDKKQIDLKEKTKARHSSSIFTEGKKVDAFALKQKKKLFKSRTDKKFLGVCGGIANYLGLDATLIRILFAVFFLVGSGSPLLIYFILAMVLDKEPPSYKD
jgi:phage shock protein C